MRVVAAAACGVVVGLLLAPFVRKRSDVPRERPPLRPRSRTRSDSAGALLHALRNPVIIGIGGASGSGKTSISEMIQHRLPAGSSACISCDSYYISLPPGKNPADHNFDHPSALEFSLLAQHLRDLKDGKHIEVPVYDFTQHKRLDETETIGGMDVIIIDGILTLAVKEVRDLCDLRIYTMEDLDVCLARRVQRDIVERGRSIESVLAQYLRFVKPSFKAFVEPSTFYADIVLPNARDNHTAQMLLARDIVGQIAIRRRELLRSRGRGDESTAATRASDADDADPSRPGGDVRAHRGSGAE